MNRWYRGIKIRPSATDIGKPVRKTIEAPPIKAPVVVPPIRVPEREPVPAVPRQAAPAKPYYYGKPVDNLKPETAEYRMVRMIMSIIMMVAFLAAAVQLSQARDENGTQYL